MSLFLFLFTFKIVYRDKMSTLQPISNGKIRPKTKLSAHCCSDIKICPKVFRHSFLMNSVLLRCSHCWRVVYTQSRLKGLQASVYGAMELILWNDKAPSSTLAELECRLESRTNCPALDCWIHSAMFHHPELRQRGKETYKRDTELVGVYKHLDKHVPNSSAKGWWLPCLVDVFV